MTIKCSRLGWFSFPKNAPHSTSTHHTIGRSRAHASGRNNFFPDWQRRDALADFEKMPHYGPALPGHCACGLRLSADDHDGTCQSCREFRA